MVELNCGTKTTAIVCLWVRLPVAWNTLTYYIVASMTLTLRLDQELERQLARASAQSGLPKSQIVKQGLREYLAHMATRRKTAYELGKDLFGKGPGSGLGDLSVRRKEYLTEILRVKRVR